jgi:hypothetical protein
VLNILVVQPSDMDTQHSATPMLSQNKAASILLLETYSVQRWMVSDTIFS